MGDLEQQRKVGRQETSGGDGVGSAGYGTDRGGGYREGRAQEKYHVDSYTGQEIVVIR